MFTTINTHGHSSYVKNKRTGFTSEKDKNLSLAGVIFDTLRNICVLIHIRNVIIYLYSFILWRKPTTKPTCSVIMPLDELFQS